tara:strand:+ start:11721 stop:25529 length:13809 start_codon:yes stop_codon:yes gene_type:complete
MAKTQEELEEEKRKKEEELGISLPDLDFGGDSKDTVGLPDLDFGGEVDEPIDLSLPDLDFGGQADDIVVDQDQGPEVDEYVSSEITDEEVLEEISKYQTIQDFESAIQRGEVSDNAYKWYAGQSDDPIPFGAGTGNLDIETQNLDLSQNRKRFYSIYGFGADYNEVFFDNFGMSPEDAEINEADAVNLLIDMAMNTAPEPKGMYPASEYEMGLNEMKLAWETPYETPLEDKALFKPYIDNKSYGVNDLSRFSEGKDQDFLNITTLNPKFQEFKDDGNNLSFNPLYTGRWSIDGSDPNKLPTEKNWQDMYKIFKEDDYVDQMTTATLKRFPKLDEDEVKAYFQNESKVARQQATNNLINHKIRQIFDEERSLAKKRGTGLPTNIEDIVYKKLKHRTMSNLLGPEGIVKDKIKGIYNMQEGMGGKFYNKIINLINMELDGASPAQLQAEADLIKEAHPNWKTLFKYSDGMLVNPGKAQGGPPPEFQGEIQEFLDRYKNSSKELIFAELASLTAYAENLNNLLQSDASWVNKRSGKVMDRKFAQLIDTYIEHPDSEFMGRVNRLGMSAKREYDLTLAKITALTRMSLFNEDILTSQKKDGMHYVSTIGGSLVEGLAWGPGKRMIKEQMELDAPRYMLGRHIDIYNDLGITLNKEQKKNIEEVYRTSFGEKLGIGGAHLLGMLPKFMFGGAIIEGVAGSVGLAQYINSLYISGSRAKQAGAFLIEAGIQEATFVAIMGPEAVGVGTTFAVGKIPSNIMLNNWMKIFAKNPKLGAALHPYAKAVGTGGTFVTATELHTAIVAYKNSDSWTEMKEKMGWNDLGGKFEDMAVNFILGTTLGFAHTKSHEYSMDAKKLQALSAEFIRIGDVKMAEQLWMRSQWVQGKPARNLGELLSNFEMSAFGDMSIKQFMKINKLTLHAKGADGKVRQITPEELYSTLGLEQVYFKTLTGQSRFQGELVRDPSGRGFTHVDNKGMTNTFSYAHELRAWLQANKGVKLYGRKRKDGAIEEITPEEVFSKKPIQDIQIRLDDKGVLIQKGSAHFRLNGKEVDISKLQKFPDFGKMLNKKERIEMEQKLRETILGESLRKPKTKPGSEGVTPGQKALTTSVSAEPPSKTIKPKYIVLPPTPSVTPVKTGPVRAGLPAPKSTEPIPISQTAEQVQSNVNQYTSLHQPVSSKNIKSTPTDSQTIKNKLSSIRKSSENITKWEKERSQLTVGSPKALKLTARIDKETKSIEKQQKEIRKQRIRDAKKTEVGKKLSEIQETTSSVRNYLDNNRLSPVDKRRLKSMGIDFTQVMKEDLNIRKITDDLNYDVSRILKTGQLDIGSYQVILENFGELMSGMTSKVDIFKAKQLDIKPPTVEKGISDYLKKGKIPSFKLEDARVSIQASKLSDVKKAEIIQEIDRAIDLRDKSLKVFEGKEPKKTILLSKPGKLKGEKKVVMEATYNKDTGFYRIPSQYNTKDLVNRLKDMITLTKSNNQLKNIATFVSRTIDLDTKSSDALKKHIARKAINMMKENKMTNSVSINHFRDITTNILPLVLTPKQRATMPSEIKKWMANAMTLYSNNPRSKIHWKKRYDMISGNLANIAAKSPSTLSPAQLPAIATWFANHVTKTVLKDLNDRYKEITQPEYLEKTIKNELLKSIANNLPKNQFLVPKSKIREISKKFSVVKDLIDNLDHLVDRGGLYLEEATYIKERIAYYPDLNILQSSLDGFFIGDTWTEVARDYAAIDNPTTPWEALSSAGKKRYLDIIRPKDAKGTLAYYSPANKIISVLTSDVKIGTGKLVESILEELDHAYMHGYMTSYSNLGEGVDAYLKDQLSVSYTSGLRSTDIHVKHGLVSDAIKDIFKIDIKKPHTWESVKQDPKAEETRIINEFSIEDVEIIDNTLAELHSKDYKKDISVFQLIAPKTSKSWFKPIIRTIDGEKYLSTFKDFDVKMFNAILALYNNTKYKYLVETPRVEGMEVLYKLSEVNRSVANPYSSALQNSGLGVFDIHSHIIELYNKNLWNSFLSNSKSKDPAKAVRGYKSLPKPFEMSGYTLDIRGVKNPYLDASNEGIYEEHINRINRFVNKVVNKTGKTKESVLIEINNHITKVKKELGSLNNPFGKSNVKISHERYIASGRASSPLKEAYESESVRKKRYSSWTKNKENAIRNMSLATRAINSKLGASNNLSTRIQTDADGSISWKIQSGLKSGKITVVDGYGGREFVGGKYEFRVVTEDVNGLGKLHTVSLTRSELRDAKFGGGRGEKRGLMQIVFEKVIRQNSGKKLIKKIPDSPEIIQSIISNLSKTSNQNSLVLLKKWRDEFSVSNKLFGKNISELTEAEMSVLRRKFEHPETAEEKRLSNLLTELISDLTEAKSFSNLRVKGFTTKGVDLKKSDIFLNPNRKIGLKGYTDFKVIDLVDRLNEYELIKQSNESAFKRLYRFMSSFYENAYALREESRRVITNSTRILGDKKVEINGKETTFAEAFQDLNGQLTSEYYEQLQKSMVDFLNQANISESSLNAFGKEFPEFYGSRGFMNLKEAVNLAKVFDTMYGKEGTFKEYPPPEKEMAIKAIAKKISDFNINSTFRDIEIASKEEFKNSMEHLNFTAKEYLESLKDLQEILKNNLPKINLKDIEQKLTSDQLKDLVLKNIQSLIDHAQKNIPNNIVSKKGEFESSWKLELEKINSLFGGMEFEKGTEIQTTKKEPIIQEGKGLDLGDSQMSILKRWANDGSLGEASQWKEVFSVKKGVNSFGDVNRGSDFISGLKLQPIKPRENTVMFVMESGGEVAGILRVIRGEDPSMPGKESMVTHSRVHPLLKKKGLGSRMYTAVNQVLINQGWDPIVSDPRLTNEAGSLWRSLVKRGLAEEITDTYGYTRYKMLEVPKSTVPKERKPGKVTVDELLPEVKSMKTPLALDKIAESKYYLPYTRYASEFQESSVRFSIGADQVTRVIFVNQIEVSTENAKWAIEKLAEMGHDISKHDANNVFDMIYSIASASSRFSKPDLRIPLYKIVEDPTVTGGARIESMEAFTDIGKERKVVTGVNKPIESAVDAVKDAFSQMQNAGDIEARKRLIESVKISKEASDIIERLEKGIISATGDYSKDSGYETDGFDTFLSNIDSKNFNYLDRVAITNKIIELFSSTRYDGSFSAFEVMTGRQEGIVPVQDRLYINNIENIEQGNIIKDVFGNEYMYVNHMAFPVSSIKYASDKVLDILNRTGNTPILNVHHQVPKNSIDYTKDRVFRTTMGFIVLNEKADFKRISEHKPSASNVRVKDVLEFFYGKEFKHSTAGTNLTIEAQRFFSSVLDPLIPVHPRAKEAEGYIVDIEKREIMNSSQGLSSLINSLEEHMIKNTSRDGSDANVDRNIIQSLTGPDGKITNNPNQAIWDAYNFNPQKRIWANTPQEVSDYIRNFIEQKRMFEFSNLEKASQYLKNFVDIWVKHAVLEGRQFKGVTTRKLDQKLLKNIFIPKLDRSGLESYITHVEKVAELLKKEEAYNLIENIAKWRSKVKKYAGKKGDVIYEDAMGKLARISLKNMTEIQEFEEYLSLLKTRRLENLDLVNDYINKKKAEKVVEEIDSWDKDNGDKTDSADSDAPFELSVEKEAMKETVKVVKNSLDLNDPIYDRKIPFISKYLNISDLIFDSKYEDVIPHSLQKKYIESMNPLIGGRTTNEMYNIYVDVMSKVINKEFNEGLSKDNMEIFSKKLEKGTAWILFDQFKLNGPAPGMMSINHIGAYFGDKGMTTKNTFHKWILNELNDADGRVIKATSQIQNRLISKAAELKLKGGDRHVANIVGMLTEKPHHSLTTDNIKKILELEAAGYKPELFTELKKQGDLKTVIQDAILKTGGEGLNLSPYETNKSRAALYNIINSLLLDIKKDTILVSLGKETGDISRAEIKEKMRDAYFSGASNAIRKYEKLVDRWVSKRGYKSVNEFLDDVINRKESVLDNDPNVMEFLNECRTTCRDVATGVYTEGMGIRELAALTGVESPFYEDYMPLNVFKVQFENQAERTMMLEGPNPGEWILPKEVYDNVFRGIHKNKSIGIASEWLKNRSNIVNVAELDPVKSISNRMRSEVFYGQTEIQRAIIQKMINTADIFNSDKAPLSRDAKRMITELFVNYFNNGMTKGRAEIRKTIQAQKKMPIFKHIGSPVKLLMNMMMFVRGSELGRIVRAPAQITAAIGNLGFTEGDMAGNLLDSMKSIANMMQVYKGGEVAEFLETYAPVIFARAYSGYDLPQDNVNSEINRFKKMVKDGDHKDYLNHLMEDWHLSDITDIQKMTRLQLWPLIQVDRMTAFISFFTHIHDLHRQKGTKFDLKNPDLEIIREAELKTAASQGSDSTNWKSSSIQNVHKVGFGQSTLGEMTNMSVFMFLHFVQTALASTQVNMHRGWKSFKDKEQDRKKRKKYMNQGWKSLIWMFAAFAIFRPLVDEWTRRKREKLMREYNFSERHIEEQMNKKYGPASIGIKSLFDFIMPVQPVGWLLAETVESLMHMHPSVSKDFEIPGKPFTPEIFFIAEAEEILESVGYLVKDLPKEEGYDVAFDDLKREILNDHGESGWDFVDPRHEAWIRSQLAMQTLLASKGLYIPYYDSEYRKKLVLRLMVIKEFKARQEAEKIGKPGTKTLPKKWN